MTRAGSPASQLHDLSFLITNYRITNTLRYVGLQEGVLSPTFLDYMGDLQKFMKKRN